MQRPDVGKMVKSIRNSVDMNQREFAKAIGVNANYVSKVERNRMLLPKSWIKKIGERFWLTDEETIALTYGRALCADEIRIRKSGLTQDENQLVSLVTGMLGLTDRENVIRICETIERQVYSDVHLA